MKIETIHESLVNGQRRQMVEQIKEYGVYDFWDDYRKFLDNMWFSNEEFHSHGEDAARSIWGYFTDATISYFRITNKQGKRG